METVNEVLENVEFDDMIVRLPNVQLDRKLYLQVSKKLELIGGKWNRKNKGFLFQQNPQELVSRVLNENGIVNLKKEFQFFETPPELAQYMVELAGLTNDDIVLEPSAGQGAILHFIDRFKILHWCELMELNRTILIDKGYNREQVGGYIGDDFLQLDCSECYTKIIANPPYSKNQDIDHIYKMWEVLKLGGTIITLSSRHWTFSERRKEVEFRAWLDTVQYNMEEIPEGTFKNSGTKISAVLLTIRK